MIGNLNCSNGSDRLDGADNDSRDTIRRGKGDNVCIGDRTDTFRGCEKERIRQLDKATSSSASHLRTAANRGLCTSVLLVAYPTYFSEAKWATAPAV